MCLTLLSALAFQIKISAAVQYLPWQWTETNYNYYDTYQFSDTDSSNNIYVTNLAEKRVEKYDSNGVFVRNYYADWNSPDSQFYSIKGIAIDSSNNLIVIDNNINKVHIISNAGNLISEFATQGTADNQLSSPKDVAVDAAGNIYIADYGNNFVKKFDSSGNYISKFSVTKPIGVAVDSSGNIYVSREAHYVHKYDSAFVLQWSHGGYGSGDTQLAYPKGIDVDSVGNVWIADSGVYRYKKLDTNGNYIYKFGTYGTSNYQFKSPACISVDSAGNIITIDDNEIKKFSVQSTGYQIGNLNAGLDIIDRTSKINIESGAPYGATGSAYPLRILTTAGRILSDVNADLTGDLSWPLVVGDSDRATGKSYIANLTAEPGASATHTLYVPIPLGVVSREVYICPDATDMASVNTSCTNGVTRSFGSSSESFGNITITQTGILGDGVTYWKIEGMTGSGGIYEELSFSGAGDGSLGNPYQITTCNQLQEIQNNLSSNFILNNDIDCSSLDYNGGIFMPIGSSIDPFTGSLNGNNFSISNLEMDKPYDSVTQVNNVTGLFGYTNGANIHDLDLINSTIYGNNYVGSLIGYAVASTISNVTASGNIFSNRFNYQNEYIGGLIGYIDGASTIDLASSSVIISFGDDVNLVGGLIGVINGTTIINDSFATGSISLGIDSYWVGGFVGMIGEEMSNADVIINDSYATGNILVGEDAPWDDGNNYWVGGFAGQIGSSENNNVNNTTGTITNCYATGNIEARYADNTWIGGFSGEISGYSVVTNSYSTGSITSGQDANSIGGFTGSIRGINPEIYLSWSSGDITLNSYDAFGVGGFAGWVGVGGYTNDYIIVEDSYSLGDISVGATGNETEWSAMIGGFAGWIKGMITTNPMEISNCFSMGNISAIGEVIEVGGFVGGITGNGTNGTGSVVIDNTASLGNFVEGYYELGGYAGTIDVATAQSLVIKNSYTRSNIVSKFIEIGNLDQALIAGFVPYVDTTGTSSTNIFNNYSTSSFSQFDSVGATISTALTNPIIITQDTFAVDDPTGITQGTYLIINRPVGAPFATTLTAPMNATQFSADVIDASGLYEYSRITIDPGDPSKEEVVQISTIAGNVLSLSSREGTITHDAGAVVVLDQYSISELVYVEAVNGNNITVRRAEGYTTERDFPAGTTVNDFQFPLPTVKGFVDTISPGNVLFENNYWDAQLSGVSDSAEGIGLTTAQMKDPDSFIGFNFSTYWSTNPLVNDEYPFLSFDDPTIVSFDTTEGLLQPSFHRHTHVYNIDVDTSVDTISFKADATEALIRQIDIDGSPIADNVYTGALTLVD